MAAQKSKLTRYLMTVVLCFALVGALVAVAARLTASARVATYSYDYRIEPPEGVDPEAALRRSADTVRARLEAMGDLLKLHDGAVRTRAPDVLELTLQSAVDPRENAAPAWLTTPGRIAFHLVHPRRTPDSADEEPPAGYRTALYRTEQYSLVRAPDVRTVETAYFIADEPELVLDGVREASMHTIGLERTTVLILRFHESDAPAFAALTALHAGRHMAMLVDGEMFFPPKEIEGALTADAVQVQGPYAFAPLERLAALLNAGTLPARLVPLEGDAYPVRD